MKSYKLTNGEEFVKTLGSLLNELFPATVVVPLPGQPHHPHLVNEGVCADDVVALLRVSLLHVDGPSGFTGARQSYYHHHLWGGREDKAGETFAFLSKLTDWHRRKTEAEGQAKENTHFNIESMMQLICFYDGLNP